MGRPLQMNVPVRFASTDDSGECVHADVFYGETRLAATRVRATVLGPPEQRRIRVESDMPIDEPVVTVSIVAGCRNALTRNYTLLPEFPSERAVAVADARTAMADALPVAPLRASTAAARSPRHAPVPAGAAAGSHRSGVAQATTDARPVPPARRGHKPRAHSDAPPAGARLSLEPMETPPTQDLRVSPSLAEPEGDAGRRATAALLWRAINADPQEILRTGAMLQKLEQELAALRQNAAQTHQEIAALRQRLDQPRPWYASDSLVKLLALLVLVAATAAGVLVYRLRRSRGLDDAWYAPPEPDGSSLHEEERVIEERPLRPGAVSVFPLAADFDPRRPVDAIDVPLARPAAARQPPSSMAVDLAGTPPPAPEPLRRNVESALRVETLAATFVEVEFLHSLGLTQDAIDRLKAYLQDSDRPAPLAYLELMRLGEEAGDGAAVAAVRRRYASTFGVEAPRLPQISADTGVDAMPHLSARLTRTWGSPDALATLEQALFSVATPAAPMSARAGRELLSLHELALTMPVEQGGTASGTAADAHPLAPWAEAQDAHEAEAALAEAPEMQVGGLFGLDLDLSEKTAAAAEVSTAGPPELQLAPLPQPTQVAPDPELERRREEDAAEAFSAAVASERVPVSRY
jgi:pilus assembly protein FimV